MSKKGVILKESFPDEVSLNRLYRYARTLTTSKDDAFDLVHTVLERWFRKPGAHVNDVVPYLFRALRNQFIDQARSEQRLAWTVFDENVMSIQDEINSLEQMVVDQDAVSRVWAVLSLAERELLFLWAVEGYSMAELSDITQTPRGTLLARIHRLRLRIQYSMPKVLESLL